MYKRLGEALPSECSKSLVFKYLHIDTERCVAELHVHVCDTNSIPVLDSVRTLLQDQFEDALHHVVLRARYGKPLPLDQYLKLHWPDLCYDLHSASHGILAYLEPCRLETRDNRILLHVVSDVAAHALRSRGCPETLRACLERDLGTAYAVELHVGDFSAEISNNLDQRRAQLDEEIRAERAVLQAERQHVLHDSGRVTAREPRPIGSIHAERPLNRQITVRGAVVSYRPAEGDAFYERFCLTDYHSSVDCFLRTGNGHRGGNGRAQAQPLLQLTKGDWLQVSGVIEQPREELELRVERVERIEARVRQEQSADHRVELHAHTKMSQMDGLTSPADLIERAAFWQHPAIGITDHGNVHAFPELYALGRKHKIKVLLGMEGYLINRTSTEIEEIRTRREKAGRGLSREELAEFKSDVHHIILYARTTAGLRNLYELVTLSHCQFFYSKPLLPRDVLLQYRDGLLIGSACECGELYRLVLNRHTERLTETEFAERFAAAQALYDYIEIQPRANNAFYIAKGVVGSEADLEAINQRLCALGEQYGKPVVATGDVHVLDEHEMLLRRVLQVGQGYDKGSDESSDTPLYFKTTDEMLAEFAYLGEALARRVVIENPQRVAALAQDIAPLPAGFHPPRLAGAEAELRRVCQERCHALYGAEPHPLVLARMERELGDIITNRFADLYILAHKVVKKSLDDGFIVGSRGSVGSSFVAFLAEITEVNSLPPHYACAQCSLTEFVHYDATGAWRAAPLDGITAEVGVDLPPRICSRCGAAMDRHGFDIPFETFVGFEGNKTPDIDLNFASEYQERAHRYIEDLFGKQHVFRAGTISTLQDRTAFAFVQKYLEKTGEHWPQAEINRIIDGLVGIKRTTGQHPGGMIILPQDKAITEFCPVQYPANNADSANQTTHFDYHAMEDQLLKLDILGHDDPTQIRLLSEYTGTDITRLPLNDEQTLSLFSGVTALGASGRALRTRVGTAGIPEFGTEFVRSMLEDTRPRTFADLIRVSGLSHGNDVWLGNARDIIKNNLATLQQCICTRDDIMHYLIEKGIAPFAAFKIMEQVRKGRGLTPDDVALLRNHAVPDWYIESCQKIKYMFPKAHAVAYVINAVRIAYCKVHHPVAYYATYFTVMRHALNVSVVAGGTAAVRAAIEALEREGRRKLSDKDQNALSVFEIALEMCVRGIRMRPVDIYASDAVRCVIENGEIIPPFTALPGLGTAAAESIVSARAQGPFKSREDFQTRTRCNRTSVDVLVQAGALDGLPESDQMEMFGANVLTANTNDGAEVPPVQNPSKRPKKSAGKPAAANAPTSAPPHDSLF
jgi:DNA polymerase-3 subunit alpha (Gram-positive type)